MSLRPEIPHKPPFNLNSRSGALMEPKLFSVLGFITMYFNCPSDYKVHEAIVNVSVDHCQILKSQGLAHNRDANKSSKWKDKFLPNQKYIVKLFSMKIMSYCFSGPSHSGAEACKEASLHIPYIALAKTSMFNNNGPDIFKFASLSLYWDKEWQQK